MGKAIDISIVPEGEKKTNQSHREKKGRNIAK